MISCTVRWFLGFSQAIFAYPTVAMSYQFIFIQGQPDAQQIQQVAATAAPPGAHTTTLVTGTPRAQLLAPPVNPALGASSITAPQERSKGSTPHNKTSTKPSIHYKPPARSTTSVNVRPPSQSLRPEKAPPGKLSILAEKAPSQAASSRDPNFPPDCHTPFCHVESWSYVGPKKTSFCSINEVNNGRSKTIHSTAAQ